MVESLCCHLAFFVFFPTDFFLEGHSSGLSEVVSEFQVLDYEHVKPFLMCIIVVAEQLTTETSCWLFRV